MKSPAVALTLVAVVLALGAARQARGASIDPLLLPVLSGQATPQGLGLPVGAAAPGGAGEPLLSVSLRFSGSPDQLRSLGIPLGGVLGDVATADVSVAQLRVLASHPAVRSIEAARPLRTQLDASVPQTGLITRFKDEGRPEYDASKALRGIQGTGWDDTSLTGRGVLIGIIDTGVDLRHDDFLKPDGTTRVLAVWDQSTAVGRPPRGFSYGAECTAAQVNTRDCPQVDRDGHGTHVAGIAAGDGSATGGDQPAYRYIGMAPEADLLVVKLADLTAPRVIDALDYLKTKAAGFQKPIVVNMSFGGTLGPHDGTLNLDRAVDNFTRFDDETRPAGENNRPGGIAVVSAGNDGQTATGNPLHAVGCFQTGSPAPACPTGIAALSGAIPAVVSFVVPGETTTVVLEIWYPGTATLGVAVTGPSECATPKASLTGTTVVTASTPCGTIVIGAGDTSQTNGDRSSVVSLTSESALRSGIWSLAVTGDSLPASGATRFDVWSAAIPSDSQVVFNTFGSPETTITSPASAAEAITVVPYISKPSTVFFNGSCIAAPPSNDLSPVASRGPLRPCTACATQELKPDLAAPGLMIYSSLSSRVPEDNLICRLDPDRRHHGLEGSSMAAPHVAGAAALLLQLNPTLTAQQVKAYLLDHTAAPQVPLPHPVESWGRGRLNVQAAVAAMKAAGDDPPPTPPAGLRVTSVRSQRVALAWDPSPDLDLRRYQVFRRIDGDPVVVRVRELPPTETTVEDTDPLLTNGTAYLYTVQALDMSNLSSGALEEVRAVPTAGEGSVGFCFIATAAYGSAWDPHVMSLRTFRDRHLRPHAVGRAAIAAYETMSPPFARFIAPHPSLRAAVRAALTPVVLTIEHPRAAAALLWLGVLGTLGLWLRRRAA